MTNLKQTKLTTAILCLILCQSSISGDKTTKEETPAAASSKSLRNRCSELQRKLKEATSDESLAASSTGAASLRSARPAGRPMTDEEIDAKAIKEYDRDIGLSDTLKGFAPLFEKASKAPWSADDQSTNDQLTDDKK